MKVFNEYLAHTNLAPLMRMFTEHGELVCYGKGDYFLREGEQSSYIGFIRSGIFKYEKTDSSGAVHVVGFNFDNDFVCDYLSFLRQGESLADVVASCNCEVYRLSYNKLMHLLHDDLSMKEVWQGGCEGFALTMYKRLLDFYCKTPQERYLMLLKRFPDIIHCVPLKEIASFVGIQAETLSRIRRKLEKNS